MTHQQFKDWLEKLKKIWETRKPLEITNICAENFLWYETPFSKPLTTKQQLIKEWEGILNQEDITVSYDILSVSENFGLTHWSATFTRLPSKEKVALDGIFKVSLNEEGKCTEFHQWYNSKE